MKNSPLIKIDYPCQFPIKIMGICNKTFSSDCIIIIKRHCKNFDSQKDILIKTSKTGKYLSITANIIAESREHLDSLYQAINNHPDVRFTL